MAFFRAVRKFSESVKPWEGHISHEVTPDESWDLTLVSERVYGRRDEYLAVMAAAGLSTVDQELKAGRRIALPTESQLYSMKRQAGFESQSELREGRSPVWL